MLLYNCLPVLSNLHRNLPFLTCTDSSYYSLNDIHTTGFFVSAVCSIKKSGNPVDILNQRGMEGQGMASTYTVLVVITKNHMQEKKTNKHHQMSTEDAKYNWGLLVTRGRSASRRPSCEHDSIVFSKCPIKNI